MVASVIVLSPRCPLLPLPRPISSNTVLSSPSPVLSATTREEPHNVARRACRRAVFQRPSLHGVVVICSSFSADPSPRIRLYAVPGRPLVKPKPSVVVPDLELLPLSRRALLLLLPSSTTTLEFVLRRRPRHVGAPASRWKLLPQPQSTLSSLLLE
jgi:hypothetical protein